MLITIHDKDMLKVGFLSDVLPKSTKFKNDKWHRYRPTGISTFDFSVSKKDGKYKNIHLEEASYFSFQWKGKDHVFSITRANNKTNSDYIDFETIDLNASIIYEEANTIVNTSSHDIVWYLQQSGIAGDGQFKIGVNEVSGVRRTLKYDGGSDTKVARLQDIMASFGAEFEFETVLHDNGQLKEVKLHIYKEHDETHQGVGRRRDDLPPLMEETGLKVVGHDIDYKSIWTAVRVDGKDGLTFRDASAEIMTPSGLVEYKKTKGDLYYRAPHAASLFPGNIKQAGLNITSYREKHLKTDFTKVPQLMDHALAFLKSNAYPKIKFTASADPGVVRSERFDIDLGDTWELSTKKITNDDKSPLLLEFRVDEIIMSHTEPDNDELVFSNFKKLKSQIGTDLLDRVKELMEQRLPYTLDLATDNGTVFKNGTGNSLITPILKRGTERISGASFVWTVGTDTQTAQTYNIAAENVNGTQLVSVEAIVDGQSVAKSEITFTDVTDGVAGARGPAGPQGATGPQGPKGDKGDPGQRGLDGLQGPKGEQGLPGAKGADGKSSYTHIAYATNATGTAGFSLSDPTNKTYIGIYVDQSANDSTNPSAYKWTLIKGADGANGTPGKAGADGRTPYLHIAYATNAAGTAGFSVTDSVGKTYIGQYTDYTQADSTDPKKYKWSLIQGPQGATGPQGKQGVQGPTGPQGPAGARGPQGATGPAGTNGAPAYFFMAYADSATGAGFSLTDSSKRYMGYYSNNNPTQSASASSYKWVDRSNVVATFVQSTAPTNPPEGARWKYTGSATITANSSTIKAGEQYLFIAGKWVKDVITSDNLQIKNQFIDGNMIKDKAVTVSKLLVDSLSAVSANLGNVTAGDILLQRSFGASKSALPVFNIPAHKTGLFIDNHGLIANGTPVQKTTSEATASDMPVVAVTSGEIRFLRANLTDDIKTMLHQGMSDPDHGFIQFGRDNENRNALVISANGQIYLKGENYTDWAVSTINSKVKWKVQGNLVIVDYDVSFSSGGNKQIVTIPTKYVPKALMLSASAWYTTPSKDKKAQLNPDGGLHILNVDVNQRYCGQIVWAY